jgi:hypothetical protein
VGFADIKTAQRKPSISGAAGYLRRHALICEQGGVFPAIKSFKEKACFRGVQRAAGVPPFLAAR